LCKILLPRLAKAFSAVSYAAEADAWLEAGDAGAKSHRLKGFVRDYFTEPERPAADYAEVGGCSGNMV
jgi:hypothetical protein